VTLRPCRTPSAVPLVVLAAFLALTGVCSVAMTGASAATTRNAARGCPYDEPVRDAEARICATATALVHLIHGTSERLASSGTIPSPTASVGATEAVGNRYVAGSRDVGSERGGSCGAIRGRGWCDASIGWERREPRRERKLSSGRWSPRPPPGYASRCGIPPSNVANADFIETATLEPGTPFVTRAAPPPNPSSGQISNIHTNAPDGRSRQRVYTHIQGIEQWMGHIGGKGLVVKVLYCRCTDGHYFVGPACPLDGWSSATVRQLNHVFNLLVDEGRELSIDALRQQGCGDEAIERAVVVEFGSTKAVYDAIEPAAFIIEGKRWSLSELPSGYK
jgi:hypothetical protein